MLVNEDGPFDIFVYWRGFLFEKLSDESWIFRGFNCVLCISFWLSFVGALFLPGNFLINAFGVAGAVALICLFLELQS